MNLPPTVCLDGAAVRRIREEKRLTQLYVAKVVGVTTDTISRWENNRYPTVRRENLFKLGEALESPVHLLVKLDDPDHECAAQSSGEGVDAAADSALVPAKRHFSLLRLFFLLLLVVTVVVIYLVRSEKPPAPVPVAADFFGSRVLPYFAAPGTVIPVRVRLKVDDVAHGYIVREHFPPGWEVIEAMPAASSIDNQDGMARWIIKQGEKHSLIVYLVRADPRSPVGMIGRFHGEIISNLDDKNQSIVLSGDTEVKVAPYTWSDLDGDSIVDDEEMLEASQAFEELNGVHLDWKELELLWDAGHYRFDPATRRFLPQRNEPGKPAPKH